MQQNTTEPLSACLACLDQYESIDGYATVDEAAADRSQPKVSSSSNSSATLTPDNDATEPIYLAYKSYRRRKSGEVDLKQGGAVTVMQRELTGKSYRYTGWAKKNGATLFCRNTAQICTIFLQKSKSFNS